MRPTPRAHFNVPTAIPALALLLTALVGCEGDATGPGERRVGPDGGVLTLAGGAVTLSVPRGALSEEIWFTAIPTLAVPGSTWMVAGSAYEVGPVGTVLHLPVTLSLSYAPENLPEGIGEEGLGVFQVVGGEWELKGEPSVNTIARTVSGQVTSLSRFGVLAIPISTMEVEPESADLEPGGSVQLTALPMASDGTVLGSRPVSWSTSDPAVATVTATGRVTGVGEGTTTITATGGDRSGTASVTVRIPVASVAVTPASGALIVGTTLQLTATARDAAGSGLPGRIPVWSSSDPTVASVGSGGLVTATGLGSAAITAAVEGKSGTATVSVYGALTVTTAALARGVVGAPYDQTLAATGGNGSYSWSLAAGSLPAGLTLDPASGLISGVPDAAGLSTFTFAAQSAGQTATRSLSISVDLVPVASVEVLPGSAGVTLGDTVRLTAVARDSGGNVLSGRVVTWRSGDILVATVSETGLVTGVALGSVTVTATADGFPGWATVTVSDSLSITTASMASGVVGAAYADTVAALGGDGHYAWTIADGALPTGLALEESSGVVTGTPTGAGAGTFSLRVNSGDGQTASRALSIVVYAPLAVSTSSLAGAVTGIPYTQVLAATGGNGAYTWSVTAGALPDGLTLDGDTGVVSGTPAGPGAWAFTVEALSGDGQTATRALSITVG